MLLYPQYFYFIIYHEIKKLFHTLSVLNHAYFVYFGLLGCHIILVTQEYVSIFFRCRKALRGRKCLNGREIYAVI